MMNVEENKLDLITNKILDGPNDTSYLQKKMERNPFIGTTQKWFNKRKHSNDENVTLTPMGKKVPYQKLISIGLEEAGPK